MKTNDSHVHSNIQGKMKREIVKQRKRWKETPRIERHKLRAQLRNEINNFNNMGIGYKVFVTVRAQLRNEINNFNAH